MKPVALLRAPTSRALLVLRLLVVLVGWLAAPRPAQAYPWMIRHEYTACQQCHTDPSGGGVLTAYGRGLASVEMVSRFTKPNPDGDDYGHEGDFLFGAVKLPEFMLAQVDYRSLGLRTSSGGATDSRFVLMQMDAAVHLNLGNFRMQGSVGLLKDGGAAAAQVTNGDGDVQLGSRAHWVGYEFKSADETTSVLVRAGRMNLPYGIRSIEHTLWTRQLTRSDTNAAQQHGLAVAYNTAGWRAEGMFVLGNFQVSPDKFRDRGLVGYAERAFTTRLAAGVSAQVMHADRDVKDAAPTWRHSYGAFARYSPKEPWVLSAEVDLLANTFQGAANRTGVASFASADYEPWKGLHFMATGELAAPSFDTGTNYGAWGGVTWFFLPHVDIRGDYVYRSLGSATGARVSTNALLAQLHFYL